MRKFGRSRFVSGTAGTIPFYGTGTLIDFERTTAVVETSVRRPESHPGRVDLIGDRRSFLSIATSTDIVGAASLDR